MVLNRGQHVDQVALAGRSGAGHAVGGPTPAHAANRGALRVGQRLDAAANRQRQNQAVGRHCC